MQVTQRLQARVINGGGQYFRVLYYIMVLNIPHNRNSAHPFGI
jgi:hypothetical protein